MNKEITLACAVVNAYTFGYTSDAFRVAMTEFSAHTGLIGQDAEKHCLKLAKHFVEEVEKDERAKERNCIGCAR